MKTVSSELAEYERTLHRYPEVCRFPAPPVQTFYWDDRSWEAYIANHCECAAHHDLREARKRPQRERA